MHSTLLSFRWSLAVILLFAVFIHPSTAVPSQASSLSFFQWSRDLHDVLNGVARINGIGDDGALVGQVDDREDEERESNIQRAIRALADPVRFIYQQSTSHTRRQAAVTSTEAAADVELDLYAEDSAAESDDVLLAPALSQSESPSDVFISFDLQRQNVSNWLYSFNISLTCVGCTSNRKVTAALRVLRNNLSPNEYQIVAPDTREGKLVEFTPADTTDPALAVSHLIVPVILNAYHRSDIRYFNLSIATAHVYNVTNGVVDSRELNYTVGNASTVISLIPAPCGFGSAITFTRTNETGTETRQVCLCPFDWSSAGCRTARSASCRTDVIEPINQCADNSTAAVAAARGGVAGYQEALNGDPTCSLLSDAMTNNVSLCVRCAFATPIDVSADEFMALGYIPENVTFISSLIADGFVRVPDVEIVSANYTFLDKDTAGRILFAVTGEPPMNIESQIHNLKRLSDTTYHYRRALTAQQLSSTNNLQRIPMHSFALSQLDRKQYRAGRSRHH